ncbi:TIMELESS-interacting protein [Quillaja saponaria]|uniref:TIMELESS-interacting protein n=1 Tax=Quillaja saponaria TaxID=32244 RepID=A0AAD7LZ66_QUISA|nr:TIMELESS-interacting protein [Quillaja saponaria]
MEGEKAAPTGCYKCGRPGHWSRDCPSSASNPNSNSINPNSSFKATGSGSGASGSTFGASKTIQKSSEKPKKVPRSRPKLTPDLLLSDDGLGYILRYFPRAFKYRGRGNEVRDLENLLELYSEWHSRLLPYYSYDQFVHKVEQVAATKRVKVCLKELRERVAAGGDPTKLHEPPVEHDIATDEQEAGGQHQADFFSETHNADDIQEDMFNDIYKIATEEPSQSMHNDATAASKISTGGSINKASQQVPNDGTSLSSKPEITEEQRARMEANRLKALERAAARARSLQAP